MKRNIVHRINILRLIGLRGRASMTLEREVILGILRLHILYGHTTLDRAQSKSGGRLVLVQEYAHAAMLILKRTLDGLQLLGLIVQIVDLKFNRFR